MRAAVPIRFPANVSTGNKAMNRPVKFGWALLLALLASGCDLSGSQSKSPVVGVWTYHDGPLTTTFAFNADGTCSKAVSVPDTVPESDRPVLEHGTWTIDADMLTVALSNGSPDSVEEAYRVTIGENTLVLADNGMRA